MRTLFKPESIAVIGASADEGKISGLFIAYLLKHGYEGDIYPVNPKRDTVGSLTCYPDVRDVPTVPDLVLVCLPAEAVLSVATDAIDAGAETILVVSSGFSETGQGGNVAAEAELAALTDVNDVRIIGPNSQGVINFEEHVAASFTPALKRNTLTAGNVGFVTQSGAFGGALTTMLQDSGVGLYKWVSTGNEADLESLDFFAEMAADEKTCVAAGYLEGFKDGRKLIELKRTQKGIDFPIVAFKVGRSERAQSAAASHTGKIASSPRVYEAIFRETGVIDVHDLDLFRDVIKALSMGISLPGKRVGVVSTSGGAGVHLADVIADVGLQLPDIEGVTHKEIEKHIPSYGSVLNPIDLTAQVVHSTEAFRECLRLLARDDDFDSILLQITNSSDDDAVEHAQLVADVAEESQKPIFVSWAGGIEKTRANAVFRKAGVPVFENPARCVQTIAALERFADSKRRLEESQPLPARSPAYDGDDAPPLLTEIEGKRLLSTYGIEVPAEHVVRTPENAADAAKEFESNVVLKLVSRELHHRDRIDGVRTDIAPSDAANVSEELLSIGADALPSMEGVVVQEQVEGTTELSLGIDIDPDFGPLVMLGRGGVDIESVTDVTFRTIPTAPQQAASMLDDLETIGPDDFSEGQRGAIVDAVTALSKCYMEHPWIREADVNPLIVTETGAVAVDALFVGPDSSS